MGDRLRQLRPGLAVLFMSGYGAEEVARRGLLQEGAPFIQKPFSPGQLARRVRELLDAAGRPQLSG